MSVDELKKLAYKAPHTDVDDVVDRWFVKCMSIIYLAQANNVIPFDEAKRKAVELERDYKVLKLNQKVNIEAIGKEIAEKLRNGEEVDFAKYPLSADEWAKAGKVINREWSA